VPNTEIGEFFCYCGGKPSILTHPRDRRPTRVAASGVEVGRCPRGSISAQRCYATPFTIAQALVPGSVTAQLWWTTVVLESAHIPPRSPRVDDNSAI
jgi:hypothetical protein